MAGLFDLAAFPYEIAEFLRTRFLDQNDFLSMEIAVCSLPSDRAAHGQKTFGLCNLQSQTTPNIDQVLDDDSQAYPALHSILPAIVAPYEFMVPLDDANAPFTSGVPFLSLFEPALFC